MNEILAGLCVSTVISLKHAEKGDYVISAAEAKNPGRWHGFISTTGGRIVVSTDDRFPSRLAAEMHMEKVVEACKTWTHDSMDKARAVKSSFAYKAIEEYYRGKKAERSGVPYIHHIDEGLCIMHHIDATANAMMAYCIHPILQADIALEKAVEDHDSDERAMIKLVASGSFDVLLLAMEYRKTANSYLSRDKLEDLDMTPLKEVRQMLIADKVQNRKDFEMFHQDHPRNAELRTYFANWMNILGITETEYERLCFLVEEDKKARGVGST